MRSLTEVARFALSAGASALMGKRALYCLWELTYRCNARCGICPYWQHPSPPERELRLPDIKRGLDRLHAHGCRAVNFSGGEPTIRQDLEEIIGHAASLAMWTSMVTNGSRLTRDRMCRLRDAGLDNLLMSLDSLQPDVHDAHRGIDGLHAKVLERARWLAQDFLSGHRMGGFMFVLSSKNLREIEEVLAFADDLGVYVVIQPYHDKKTGDPQYNASIDQQFVDELLRLREERTNLLCSEGYLRGLARFAAGGQGPPCSAGRKYFSIDPYGFIGPCVDMPRAGHILSDDLDVVARADVMQHVHQCPGCWYAFRGESDASLSLRGCHGKVKLGLSVLARNVRRMRRAEDLQH